MSIVNSGPSDTQWEFAGERKMGFVARSIKSRRFPFSQLSNLILRTEQLKMARRKRRSGLVKCEWRREDVISSSVTAVMRAPFELKYTLDDSERRALVAYLRTLLNKRISMAKIEAALPKTCMRAGKVRVLGERPSICGSWAASRYSRDKHHDSSFVRLELTVARLGQDGGVEEVPTCFYAQLHYIAHVTLLGDSSLDLDNNKEQLLALVSICDCDGDATEKKVWYKKFRPPRFVHVDTIQCGAGRVEIGGQRWGIIDTSPHCSRTQFGDYANDDEENFVLNVIQ
ncbi:SubName: Full=Uncharacterized protein {ECO:0000313/EMBL:CCA75912.1}; Flags: Fragment [Serendipita indica DSM 11827]|nr:SubName: Full=Uncharacterized protein {ECO:0000313/EMBL:CCA75912.1}; Flags: Fragment [Serendipita indica DSM 11827]